ncbi:MAG: peptidylprolyl isomerase [Deltaproteobacteria bacterium]|nr:peptidylprolyl isomerase [Deltaproteobacteria bacterium]
MPSSVRKAFVSLTFLVFFSAHGCVNVPRVEQTQEEQAAEKADKLKRTRAVIQTNYGEMEIMFFPEEAPLHVDNFIFLAQRGYYDGTIFHRVIPGFMIQGGDPLTRIAGSDRSSYGNGGPGYTIPGEFNIIPHMRGIVSMARGEDPGSAGSQFFVVVADSPHLDRRYTVFGMVTRGMDVADRIAALARDKDDIPDERVEIKVKIVEIKKRKRK